MKRWIVTHWRALKQYSDEPPEYAQRLAFEQGAWDGNRWDGEDIPSPDLPSSLWEAWRTGFSVTAGV